uniref:SEC-C domain-containing protein n=1 Tax=Candidatus Desulfatibia profunda TaxID=2841695 RepID=A0A8J6TM22_9BACT|nr:SEC-C domain-containing protein [Candidatus Desulfatibia profunda]
MAQWYESNRRLFRNERKELASTHPLLRLAVVGPSFQINGACVLKSECAIVHGTYSLYVPNISQEFDYGIVLVLPKNYPKLPPQMFCNDLKLPINNIDRHIMKDGRACLGVHAEIGMRWKPGSTIVTFLDDLVAPFLAWQAYYDKYHEPPPWGERSHYKQGILEFYAELLKRPIDSTIEGFMRLLARANRPKGHEPCPCNSGKRLRNCHRDMLYEAREKVAWQDVEFDLAVLNSVDDIK